MPIENENAKSFQEKLEISRQELYQIENDILCAEEILRQQSKDTEKQKLYLKS
jgi:hypothetical protein